MPNPGDGTAVVRALAWAACVAGVLACALLAPEPAVGQDAAASPAPSPRERVREIGGVRVESATFWYDCESRPATRVGTDGAAGAHRADGAAPATCAERLAAALEWVLREYPEKFPQPLPVVAVIRAVARERVEHSAVWATPLGSYGCATLERGIVVIEVGPRAFVGRDALNDAELRSLVAHELMHAYQYARGEHAGNSREIAQREIEALDWELAHLEADVRPAYRDDLEFNRRMFAAMLEP